MPNVRIKELELSMKERKLRGRNFLNSFFFNLYSHAGFTLIEILIAISIIAIVTFISVPNLRRFNQDQEVDNAAGELINSLRLAQANDMSGVKCVKSPSYVNPNGWSVQLTFSSSPPTYGYKITQDCLNSVGVNNQLIFSNKNFPSNVTFSVSKDDISTSCSTVDNVNFKFLNGGLTVTCTGVSGAVPINSYFDITVTNTISGNSKKVRIDKGGSIGLR